MVTTKEAETLMQAATSVKKLLDKHSEKDTILLLMLSLNCDESSANDLIAFTRQAISANMIPSPAKTAAL